MSTEKTRHLVLLGGPPGVGKSEVLKHLAKLNPGCSTIDADEEYIAVPGLDESENRKKAVDSVISAARRKFEIGSDLVFVAWVFARPQLYEPVKYGLASFSHFQMQLYLVAEPQILRSRLVRRSDGDKFEYSKSRLELINKLPFTRIDTTNLNPEQVAESVTASAMAGV